MTTQTVLPAPADLRGIIIDEEAKTYWFIRLVAMVVRCKGHGEYYDIDYIGVGGCVADNVIDSSDFVHGVCADMPLTVWEAENKLIHGGGPAA